MEDEVLKEGKRKIMGKINVTLEYEINIIKRY